MSLHRQSKGEKMPEPETKEVPLLPAALFIICGVTILILNIINYI